MFLEDSSTYGPAGPTIPHHPLDRRPPHCIYLAAPLPAYDLPAYGEALGYLRSVYLGPRHTVLSARELFASTPDWRRRYCRVLEPVTVFYLILYLDCAGYGCRAEWLELAGRGVPAFCFTSARTVEPIGSFALSGNPDPSLAWHVLDPWGRRIVPYRYTEDQLDRTMARFAGQQRRRDWWLKGGARVRQRGRSR